MNDFNFSYADPKRKPSAGAEPGFLHPVKQQPWREATPAEIAAGSDFLESK